MDRLRNAAGDLLSKGRHSSSATTAPASNERRAFHSSSPYRSPSPSRSPPSPSPPSPSPADAQVDEEEPPDSDTEEEEDADADSDVENVGVRASLDDADDEAPTSLPQLPVPQPQAQAPQVSVPRPPTLPACARGTSRASDTLTSNASGGTSPPASVPATSSSSIDVQRTRLIVAAQATAASHANNVSAAAASTLPSPLPPLKTSLSSSLSAAAASTLRSSLPPLKPSLSSSPNTSVHQAPSPPRTGRDFNAHSPSPSTPIRRVVPASTRQTPPVRQSPLSSPSPPRSAAPSFGGGSPFGLSRGRDICYEVSFSSPVLRRHSKRCALYSAGHLVTGHRIAPMTKALRVQSDLHPLVGGSPFGRSRDGDICFKIAAMGRETKLDRREAREPEMNAACAVNLVTGHLFAASTQKRRKK
ncbi:hypothetical protein MVEN_01984800 [Mycena venus]|uniref:Uncharacterized protein n=1 Tax=Mycena venus TaxID=2733690 RepID=A0A8H7CIM9_9AGAR|nr:hypothetical protein MVEN_01984800 [Mycena venus]